MQRQTVTLLVILGLILLTAVIISQARARGSQVSPNPSVITPAPTDTFGNTYPPLVSETPIPTEMVTPTPTATISGTPSVTGRISPTLTVTLSPTGI